MNTCKTCKFFRQDTMTQFQPGYAGQAASDASWRKNYQGRGECANPLVIGERLDDAKRTGLFADGEDDSGITFSENFGCIFHGPLCDDL